MLVPGFFSCITGYRDLVSLTQTVSRFRVACQRQTDTIISLFYDPLLFFLLLIIVPIGY